MNIVFPCIVDGMRALKDKTIKVSLESTEMATEDAARLFNLNGKYVKVLISDQNIIKEQIQAVEATKIEEDQGKSPSQRLRAVFYVWYEQNKNGFQTFEEFYRARMEMLITQVKNRLD